jgi:predicted Rossmann-fold nucleotide-binding protein
VILFGVDYWGGLIDWLRSTVRGAGKIGEHDLDLLYVTDDVDAAVAHIVGSEAGRSEQARAEQAAVADQPHS